VKPLKPDQGHPPGSEFAGQLVDLYARGLVNVVYTVSDFSALSLLSSVSGHSHRLKKAAFPSIPEEVLIEQLVKLASTKQQAQIDSERAKQTSSNSALFKFFNRQEPLPDKYYFVLSQEAQAAKIVEHFGAHMGDILSCLRAVIEKKMPVEAAIETVISEAALDVHNALMGRIGLPEDSDFLIVVADIIFEALSCDGVEKVDWYTTVVYPVRERKGVISRQVVIAAVELLVAKNLLSFVDPDNVSFHDRRIKWAYSQEKQKPSVQDAVGTAWQKVMQSK